MADRETYWNEIREKKFLMESAHSNWTAHHPSRLSKITLTGGYTLTIDERLEYTGSIPNGTTATLSVSTVSLGSNFELIRLWDKEPLGLYRSTGVVGEKYFYLQHQPSKPWRFMNIDIFPSFFLETAGTVTNTFYVWNSASSTWNQTGQSSGDISGDFGMGVQGGGEVLRGGYDPGNTDARATFSMLVEIGGVRYEAQILRYPWEQPMASDNGFQQVFQDFVDDINTNSGHNIASGTSNVMVNFVF